MNFDADFNRLERTARAIRWAATATGLIAALFLISASALWPGDYGGPFRFTTIQLHLDLGEYFSTLKVPSRLFENKLVLGIQMAKIQAVISVAQMVLGVAGVGSLIRLQWRWALGAGAGCLLLATLSTAAVTRDGYSVADPYEFGVHYGSITTDPVEAVTADTPDWKVRMIQADQARADRVQRIRGAFDGAMSELTPQQRSAMHYTAAQVAYLEEDLPTAQRHLNAIFPKDFQPTWDADYRLRIIDEWVERHGVSLAVGAYRPSTGIPFAIQRLALGDLRLLGLGTGLVALMLVELARRIVRRLKRLRLLEAKLSSGTPREWTDAFETDAATRSNFGQRPILDPNLGFT